MMPSFREQLVHQLQCEGAFTERAAIELVDAHDAEVLAADGQDYPGQLTMLAGLVATIRATVGHGDLEDVRKLLDEHASDDAAARAHTKGEAAPFFQIGHTYADPEPGRDWKFRVDMVTTHPEDGKRTALGWRFFNGEWEPIAYNEDDWEVHQAVGLTDVTEEATR